MRESLLSTVIRRRHDDRVRLIFGDWLTDHEDPWGEFIHHQVELRFAERGSPSAAPLEETRLDKQALDELELEIRRRHSPFVSGKVTSFTFGGGCVEELELTVPQFLQHGEQLVGSLPIRRIRLTTDLEGWERAMLHAAWGPIESLAVDGVWLGVDRIEQLVVSAEMKLLVDLRLTGAGVCHHGVELLADSPLAAILERLEIAGNRDVGDRGLVRLVTDPRLERLRRIGVRRCRVTDKSLREISSHPSLSKILYLDIRDNSVTVAALESLRRSPYWNKNTELRVGARKLRAK